MRLPLRGVGLSLLLLTTLGVAKPVRASDALLELAPQTDDVGFTLDEDWREWWRRILDRNSRPDQTGPIQQRFGVKQYPEHEADKASADFPLYRERLWANSARGLRWWVHSYTATELGNQVQLKVNQSIGDHVEVSTRLDRFNDRVTESNLVETDFTWTSEGDIAPYYQLNVFPRLEKEDTDFGFTIGMRDKHRGEVRLRLWGLDPFANGSYWLAAQRKPPPPLLFRQTSLPVAASFELATLRLRGLRTELYLGAVASQSRELYLDGVLHERQTESAALFGGLLEWKAPSAPLWLGSSATIVRTKWSSDDALDRFQSRRIRELSEQVRLYGIYVPNHHFVLESELRLNNRPESETGPLVQREREDHEFLFTTRAQWLLSNRVGLDLFYLRNNRSTLGEPDVDTDGGGNRIVTRLLLRYHKFLATFGVGWDPDPRRSVYSGGGGTLVVELD